MPVLTLEMVGLTLHGTKTTHLPHQPVGNFPMLARVFGVGNLVVLVVAIDEVLKDGARLKDANGLAIGVSIGQGGDTAIRVDLNEPRLFLGVLGDVDSFDL